VRTVRGNLPCADRSRDYGRRLCAPRLGGALARGREPSFLIQSFKAWGFEPIAFRFGAMVRSAARSIAQRSTSGAAARFSDRERFERREAIGLASV
jgi:hypothetical protein